MKVSLKIVPGTQVKGFRHLSHAKSLLVLVINGQPVTAFTPGSIVDKKLKRALRRSSGLLGTLKGLFGKS